MVDSKALQDLKANSIRLTGHIIVVWPQFEYEEELGMSDVALLHDGQFAVNNSVVCYVSGRKTYVTPYTRKTITTLQDAGLRRSNFYVPFSNGDFPKLQLARWTALVDQARKERQKEE